MPVVDLDRSSRRELNAGLHALSAETNETHWRVENPGGRHALGGRQFCAGGVVHRPLPGLLQSNGYRWLRSTIEHEEAA